MDYISELPDCIISIILSTVSKREMMKTSVLSKRWCKLWSLTPRIDLNFDVHNVLGNEKELREIGCIVDVVEDNKIYKGFHWELVMSEFVKRVDQLIKNFQVPKIDSFMLEVHLNSEVSGIIDEWISFALARGVERLDLCFKGKPYNNERFCNNESYQFPFGLLSESKNSKLLEHMVLQFCILQPPSNFDFIPFENLKSLTLDGVAVEDEFFVTSLLSNCLPLEELRLFCCYFNSVQRLTLLRIVSSSLCLLQVKYCYAKSGNTIIGQAYISYVDCPKLTSLDCDCYYLLKSSSMNTPVIKSFSGMFHNMDIQLALAFLATFPKLEIVGTSLFYNQDKFSLRRTGSVNHLRQLNIMTHPKDNCIDNLCIMTILQASPLLQQLKVTVINPSFNAFHQKDVKDHRIFFHDELKVVEIGGCVGNWYEVEFAMNILKYAEKLEQMVVSPYWRALDDDPVLQSDPIWFLSGRERIREQLECEGKMMKFDGVRNHIQSIKGSQETKSSKKTEGRASCFGSTLFCFCPLWTAY